MRLTGGYVPVDRSQHADAALYRHVDRCFAMGGVIAIFPEGSYGIGDPIDPAGHTPESLTALAERRVRELMPPY